MDWLYEKVGDADFAEIRNTSLGKLVRNQLLGQILKGEVSPGQALREADLVEQLKVSRAPVREALRELESMGLVVSRKHSGVYVRELNNREIHDLYNFRALLDEHAGRQASQLPAQEKAVLIERLQSCVEEMDQAITDSNTQRYYGANLRFHWLFVESANNGEVNDAYRTVIQKLHLARLKNLSTSDHRVISNQEHKEIVNALNDSKTLKHANYCGELLHHHVIKAYERLFED